MCFFLNFLKSNPFSFEINEIDKTTPSVQFNIKVRRT